MVPLTDQFAIPVGLWSFILFTSPVRHMEIVMILVDRSDNPRNVNDRNPEITSPIDEPIIPSWSANSKRGERFYGTTSRKYEVVTSSRRMEHSTISYIFTQPFFPIRLLKVP